MYLLFILKPVLQFEMFLEYQKCLLFSKRLQIIICSGISKNVPFFKKSHKFNKCLCLTSVDKFKKTMWLAICVEYQYFGNY